jgi:hypothetical protein
MVVDDSAHTGLLDDSALRRLIKGTLMATLLLAAQEGGKPMNEAAWVLVGAIVTTAVDAYATHISSHRDDRFRGYLAGLGLLIVVAELALE